MLGNNNLSALQKIEECAACILKCGRDKSGAGDQDQVQAWCDVWDESPHRFTEESFGSVPVNGCSYCSPRRDTNSRKCAWLVVSLDNQHNKRVGIGFTGTPHPLEVF